MLFRSGSEGGFSFVGLDDAVDYSLEETKAPEGYNILTQPIIFRISAVHNADGTVTVTAVADGKLLEVVDHQPTLEVVNVSGAQLPETGGIGTKVFTAVGGSLMVLAAVVFVAKRRVSL